jgi:hypothetical protein
MPKNSRHRADDSKCAWTSAQCSRYRGLARASAAQSGTRRDLANPGSECDHLAVRFRSLRWWNFRRLAPRQPWTAVAGGRGRHSTPSCPSQIRDQGRVTLRPFRYRSCRIDFPACRERSPLLCIRCPLLCLRSLAGASQNTHACRQFSTSCKVGSAIAFFA